MNNIQKSITKVNTSLIYLVFIAYAFIRITNSFLRDHPMGDEPGFLNAFKIFINQGYYEANVYGNSTFFNLFSYVFYKLFSNELLALKSTSLLFGILSLILLWYFQKKYYSHVSKEYRKVAFITSINAMLIMSFIFSGINDSILGALTILFFIILNRLKTSQKSNNLSYVFIGLVLSFMLLTRMLSVAILFPISLVMISFFYFNKFTFKRSILKGTIILATLILTVWIFNIPSINEKGTLSFHNKKLDDTITWTQLIHLTALKNSKGEIKYKEYATLTDVKQYLLENGENSLPKTLVQSIFFDVGSRLKSFSRELLYQIKPFSRLLGLFMIMNIILVFWYFIKRKITLKKILKQDVLLFSTLYVVSICFIVSYLVDPRWFLNVLLLLPFVFVERIEKFKKEKKLGNKFDFILLNLQVGGLILMSLPYIIKNIHVIF
jgi:hypothetical protein